MSLKKIVATPKAPAAIGPYSQGVSISGQFGEFLFISGQIPLDPASGQIVSDDIAAQTQRVLDNLKAVVEQGGGTMLSIVKTTIYIIDMNDFAKVNEVYKQYFLTEPPARATVQVSRLPKDVKVEIDAIAFLGQNDK
jgi:2-iminobutanoate/2-iminopropanoate deaminase